MNAHHTLVRSLMPEVFQAERAASRHARIEAHRLGPVPPGDALRAVAEHADGALTELGGLSETLQLPGRLAGQTVGAAFSVLRDGIGDHLLDPSRSYRGTLLGVHHGIDAVWLLHATARRAPDLQPLEAWCADWLATRTRLAEACVDALDWFAAFPEAAARPPIPTPLARVRDGMDALVAAGMRRGLGLVRA
jgi:hypothetical protein